MGYLAKLLFLSCILTVFMPNIARSLESQMKYYNPDNEVFDYSDYIYKKFAPSEVDKTQKAVRFNRIIVLAGKGYGWDAPGARIRLRTNAKKIIAHIFYTDKHNPERAHNSKGALLIDGKAKEDWVFSPALKVKPPAGKLSFSLPVVDDGQLHTYELIMPYGDSVDFLGMEVSADAELVKPEPRPAKRCVFYGDSVTHGFTASNILHTYPFLLSQKKGWQMLNMAIGGHASGSCPADAKQFTKFEFDVLVVAIGVNDWQGKRPPETFEKNMAAFLEGFRKVKPDVPVYMISPLWVSKAWGKDAEAKYPLDDFRKKLQNLVEGLQKKDHNLYFVDGTKLIDHDEKLFDHVLVHPNDKGFVQMSERLNKIIK